MLAWSRQNVLGTFLCVSGGLRGIDVKFCANHMEVVVYLHFCMLIIDSAIPSSFLPLEWAVFELWLT